MGLKEEILALADDQRQPVEVPEWGKTLYVRVMSARARDAWQADMAERGKKGDGAVMENARARFIALTVVDQDGKPVFSLEDAEALGEKSAKAIDRLFNAATALNKLDPASAESLEKK